MGISVSGELTPLVDKGILRRKLIKGRGEKPPRYHYYRGKNIVRVVSHDGEGSKTVVVDLNNPTICARIAEKLKRKAKGEKALREIIAAEMASALFRDLWICTSLDTEDNKGDRTDR